MTIIRNIIATSSGNIEFKLREYKDVELSLTTQYGDSSESLYFNADEFKSMVAALDEFRQVLRENGVKKI